MLNQSQRTEVMVGRDRHSGGDTTPSDDEGLSSSLESSRRQQQQQRGQLLQRLQEVMQLQDRQTAYDNRKHLEQQQRSSTITTSSARPKSGRPVSDSATLSRRHKQGQQQHQDSRPRRHRNLPLPSASESSSLNSSWRSSVGSLQSHLDASYGSDASNTTTTTTTTTSTQHRGPRHRDREGGRHSLTMRQMTRSPYAAPVVPEPHTWARPRSSRSQHSRISSSKTSSLSASPTSSRASSASRSGHRRRRRRGGGAVRARSASSGNGHPYQHHARSLSSSSISSCPRATDPRVYDKRAHTCRFIAYRNGDLQSAYRVVGRTLEEVLDACTRKMRLPLAARRLFDEQGHDLTTTAECGMLPGDAIVYASCGEPYIDPIAASHLRSARNEAAGSAQRNSALTPTMAKVLNTWRTTADSRSGPLVGTGNGSAGMGSLHLKPRRRVSEMSGRGCARVLVFENGDGLRAHTVPMKDHATFVGDCSKMFVLTSQAERFFDLDGHQVPDIAAAPECPDEVHLLFGRVLGPFWVATRTHVFKPEGALNFLQHQLHRLQRHHDAVSEHAKRAGLIADIVAQQSAKDATADVLSKLEQAITFMKKKQRKLSAMMEDTAVSRIRPIAQDNRLLAAGSLRLSIHHNGTHGGGLSLYFNLREARRTGDTSTMFGMLLAECTKALALSHSAKRLFLQGGREVRCLNELDDDMNLWVSSGEPFVPTDEAVMQLAFDGVETVLMDEKRTLIPGGAAVDTRALASSAVAVLPSLHDALACDDAEWRRHPSSPEEATLCDPRLVTLHVTPPEGGSAVLLRPLLVQGPRQPGAPLLQRWTVQQVHDVGHLSSDGVDTNTTWAEMASRAFPDLCLNCTVMGSSNSEAKHSEGDGKGGMGSSDATGDTDGCADTTTTPTAAAAATTSTASRYRVCLGKRTTPPTAGMLWHFAADGTIHSACDPSLVLTLASQGDRSSSSGDGGDEGGGGEEGGLVLRKRAQGKRARQRQQWGLKHDGTKHMGEWKMCRAVNGSRSWVKRCMLWPTITTGNWNTDLLWPLDVMLVPSVSWRAPAVKQKESLHESMERMRGRSGCSIKDTIMTMPRLRIVRNGTRMRPVEVLVPEGLRARDDRPPIDIKRTFPLDTQKWFEQRLGSGWRVILTSRENSRDAAKMRELQVELFLDRCTHALGMGVPARALYTEQGDTVSDLEQLQPNQVLLVTGGEAWVPPPSVISRLPNLETDLHTLRTLSELLSTQDAVVAVYDAADDNFLLREKAQVMLQMKANDDGAASGAAGDVHTAWALTPHRHLVSASDPSHCLAPKSLKHGAGIALVPVDTEDAQQKWVLDGPFLQTAMNSNLVLTVPKLGRQGTTLMLAKKEPEPFYAHQCWKLTPASNGRHLLQAYSCSPTVFSCSAGEQCGVCTLAMCGGREIQQAGAILEGTEGTCCLVCADLPKHRPTARAVGLSTFACAYCQSQRELCTRSGVHGPRASLVPQPIILAAKADLACSEDVETAIGKWDKCLAFFQAHEVSPSAMTRPAAPSNRLDPGQQFRARVFRNGQVDPFGAIVIVAVRADAKTQLDQFLSDATARLNLPSAARAAYTRSGTQLQSLSPQQHEELKRSGQDAPIPDLWVSMGEPFSPPDSHPETIARRKKELKQAQVQLKQNTAERKQTLKELQAKLQGALSTTERGTLQDRRDVLKCEIEEDLEQFKVNKEELRRLREKEAPASKEKDAARGSNALIQRLSKPNVRTRRVFARKNGSSKSVAVMCMGTSMASLLASCAENLGMRRARKLYTMEGKRIKSFDTVSRDMEVLVSEGAAYIDDAAKKEEEQTRASFGRAIRKQKNSASK